MTTPLTDDDKHETVRSFHALETKANAGQDASAEIVALSKAYHGPVHGFIDGLVTATNLRGSVQQLGGYLRDEIEETFWKGNN